MNLLTEERFDYQRIADTIEYISKNHLLQPTLAEIAEAIGISPFHFQRIFTRWAGVSPKKFLQFTTLTYAKELLQQQATLADTTFKTGLSGTGRLHDLFINLEGMTPGEYKNGGASLNIQYKWLPTILGDALIARTNIGICHLHFETNYGEAILTLKKKFPNAKFQESDHPSFIKALQIIKGDAVSERMNLHLKGTPFQIKVWEALLKIPVGMVSSYGALAHQLDIPTASRAVGTAIGNNPVAMLIPCHRVIQATGLLGGYHWGLSRKRVMLAREAASLQENHAGSSENSLES